MRSRKLIHMFSLFVLLSMVLAACAPAATEAPASSGNALYDAAKAEGMLTTIALPTDWCNYGAMYEGFKAKYPGIEINPLDPGAGSAEELEAIKANKDNPGPQAPDVVDIGIGLAPGAVEEGLLQPYKVSTWDDIPEGAKDPNGYWYGDYYGVLALEVNTAEVANPPAEYADLLKPEYNGQIALSGDPLTSNAAALSVWAAGLATGATGPEAAQAGLEFFKSLNEAGNFVPIDGDSRTVGVGETPILIDWSYNSIANDIALAGNPDIVTNVPKEGIIAGVYVQGIIGNGINNTLLISAQPKSYAPPTINFRVEIDGADINEINFTLGSRLTFFDIGRYGAEWRNDVTIGYRTQLLSEYFRPLKAGGYFIAPRISYTRDRQSLYLQGGARIAEYQGSRVGAGLDFGYLTRRSELRVGYEIGRQGNKVRIGMPVLPQSEGLVSLARVRWSFDGQDSPTIPRRGLLVRSEARYFFDVPDAQHSFPQAEARASYFHPITTSGSAFIAAGAGTTFTSTATPFQQFTLGGPFRLGAYGRDEFRGNHYIVGAIGYLQEIARMPPLIGGRVNAIGWVDIGDAFLSRQTFNSRPGVSLGLALDTRLGPLSLIGSYGEGGRGKLYFAFGRFF